MGRQIAIAATATDEDALLTFLRDGADIQLFTPCAPSPDGLWVERFAPYNSDATQYFIWNKAYAWKPSFGRVDADVKEHGGWYFVANRIQGPVIEFSRTNVDGFLEEPLATHEHGRIYWAKYNRQKGFAKWYDAIVRWVRKNGRNLCPESPFGIYCLPDAWALWQDRARRLPKH